VLPEPSTQADQAYYAAARSASTASGARSYASGSGAIGSGAVGQLELVTSKTTKNRKAASSNPSYCEDENGDQAAATKRGTLDEYFAPTRKSAPTHKPPEQQSGIRTNYHDDSNKNNNAAASANTAALKPPPPDPGFAASASTTASRPKEPPPFHTQQQRQQQQQTSFDPNARFSEDNFPWSQKVYQLLRDTFRIQTFRDNQKEIINATVSQDDVFVIMRTGGGKSLTYQLPALLEGLGPQRKVSFVISPLLSLIQDQEEQMNAFVPGSALSFTSGIGASEHARRWERVRDKDQGVCLVFVTPEMVNKSNRLQNEMQKLFDRRRLGRFVIDECHCVSQFGHDFRPDYTQLGILKSHFPSIPLIAVTATASNKVRDDVCQILRIGRNYRFFRSSAFRPNLQYSVRPKKDGKDVIADMVDFITEHHPTDSGIVYTFSRKDADTVARQLTESGVSARSYHSDVSKVQKETIHRDWMKNKLQCVVATIAFGLGINKPDVRFVLHHTISKTLDAYYQESGRAGRDGKEASCILYYSPKV